MNNLQNIVTAQGYHVKDTYPMTMESAGRLNPGNAENQHFSQETAMHPNSQNALDSRLESALLIQQALRYAEDMAKVYEEERGRRRALERANAALKAEIHARRLAEKALTEARQDLEKRVTERTQALSEANRMLHDEIAQRERSEEQIRGSLKEKEVLLSEVHHRVKNNLQIISSLLALQCERVTDETVRGALMDSQSRVRSMALIHEQLYRSGDLARIDFARYIEGLSKTLLDSYSSKSSRVRITADVDKVFLPVGLALPCGLIVNELLTNCLKHAFPGGRSGKVHIEFHGDRAEGYNLTVSDDGTGLPADLDWRRTRSLGLRLVVNLAEIQLDGKIHVTAGGGTVFEIQFPRQKQN